MKALKVIEDPQAFQLLADETRRKIVYLLRASEMNVSQISAQLNITPQAVYHHVKKLLKGGLVEVTREERCGHLIESYYRATAEMFSLSHGKTTAKSLRSKQLTTEQITKALQALKKVGFKIKYDEKKIAQIVDAQNELEECCEDISNLEKTIYAINNLDLFTKKATRNLAKILTMSEKDLKEEDEKRKKYRKLIISLTQD